VSVNFQQQVERGVLAVPVTALLATAGGGYDVQAISQNGQRQLVPITPGLFAGGYVQVSGSGIYEGMQVSDSQG
jgi:multidrug efflux pump subunit AcrA (membrane-fusion protein)